MRVGKVVAIGLVGMLIAFAVASAAWGQFKIKRLKTLSQSGGAKSADGGQLEFYLSLDGFGEEIPCIGFEQDLKRQTHRAGSPARGQATLEPIIVTKNVDAASPRLYHRCERGTEIPSGELGARVPGSSRSVFSIGLERVVVVAAHTSVTEDGEIVERISLSPGLVEWTFVTEGGAGAATTARWDLATAPRG